jgi:hypothetical protein
MTLHTASPHNTKLSRFFSNLRASVCQRLDPCCSIRSRQRVKQAQCLVTALRALCSARWFLQLLLSALTQSYYSSEAHIKLRVLLAYCMLQLAIAIKTLTKNQRRHQIQLASAENRFAFAYLEVPSLPSASHLTLVLASKNLCFQFCTGQTNIEAGRRFVLMDAKLWRS